MKFREPLDMWLPLFLVPRLKLLREPIFENLWPRRAIKTFCEPFVSEFDVGQGGQPLLQGWFEIVRIESRNGWPGGLDQRLGHDLMLTRYRRQAVEGGCEFVQPARLLDPRNIVELVHRGLASAPA